MNHVQHTAIVNFIWGIADDVLRDVYVRGKYRDIILPMTVLRRLDVALEPTKEAVFRLKQQLSAAGVVNQHAALCRASGQPFYNDSPFILKDLVAGGKRQQLRDNFVAYLDGFSPNVQQILDRFRFRNQIPTLVEADILYPLIQKFLDPVIDLRYEVLDNHSMGTIFEELIRRFSEENNEEAGEHFTPRDVVRLMANLIFLPVADQMDSGTYTIYDGACGTGGMLTIAGEVLDELGKQRGKEIVSHIYGQEINPETWAIAEADMLLKGKDVQTAEIAFGSTLSADKFRGRSFDFMLSNPPYGKSWKTDLERMGGKKGLVDPRFIIEHAGDPEYSLLTRSSDGQMLFLANLLSKMKHNTRLGSWIAEIHNGSSLFTGDAGQGESNIRRWIIENDWLEAIIALPLNMFYNTGIATYIWVLSNRKPEHRRGKVQLIDASEWFQPLRKNLGQKNCELGDEDIRRICDLFLEFKETEHSKIFPNEALGYWKVTVERPLRLRVNLSAEARASFRRVCQEAGEEPLADLIDRVAETIGPGPHDDFNAFLEAVETCPLDMGTRLTAKRAKLLQTALACKEETAQPVIRKRSKLPRDVDPEREALYGRYVQREGKSSWIVEYEPDTDLRDTEQIPLLEEGGIEGFFRREVLPYAPDAWIDESSIKIGYEISFTRYFYKPQPLRSLEEIRADILALEQETDGLLQQILGIEG